MQTIDSWFLKELEELRREAKDTAFIAQVGQSINRISPQSHQINCSLKLCLTERRLISHLSMKYYKYSLRRNTLSYSLHQIISDHP